MCEASRGSTWARAGGPPLGFWHMHNTKKIVYDMEYPLIKLGFGFRHRLENISLLPVVDSNRQKIWLNVFNRVYLMCEAGRGSPRARASMMSRTP